MKTLVKVVLSAAIGSYGWSAFLGPKLGVYSDSSAPGLDDVGVGLTAGTAYFLLNKVF